MERFMSSYQEFKKDVNSVATGVVVLLLLTLAFQITFLIIACLAVLILIGLSRLVSGKRPFREYLIKIFVIWFLGGMAIGAVLWWWYNYCLYPYYLRTENPNAKQETEQFMEEYWKNDPGYEGYKKAKAYKPLDNGYKGYDENKHK